MVEITQSGEVNCEGKIDRNENDIWSFDIVGTHINGAGKSGDIDTVTNVISMNNGVRYEPLSDSGN